MTLVVSSQMCFYSYCHVYIYRKVPSEHPHPCNRPPPYFFPSERLVPFKRLPRPRHRACNYVSACAINLLCEDVTKKRQSSYTVEYKLGVLRWYQDNGANKHSTARNFGIDRKRLREWLEKEDRLRDNGVGAAKKKRKCHGS